MPLPMIVPTTTAVAWLTPSPRTSSRRDSCGSGPVCSREDIGEDVNKWAVQLPAWQGTTEVPFEEFDGTRTSCHNRTMALIVGIDGGGTKTTCVLARDGQVLATANTGPSNLVRNSEEEVRKNLLSAVRMACQRAKISADNIDSACIGAAGAARQHVASRIQEIASEVLRCHIEVVGDMEIALEAAMKGGAGVVVIAGTGSIGYGRNELGETARAGGWGSVISDEGSGYWIGRRAVSAALHALDCGRSTTLIRFIMDTWNVVTRDELIAVANGTPSPNFALLVPSVFEAAEGGDIVAQEILTEAGGELSKLAKVVIRRLWPGQGAVQVAALGGIFTNSHFLFRVFDNSLRSERPTASVRLLTEEPVMGAVYKAEKFLQENPLGEVL